jgi:hypothetical protein
VVARRVQAALIALGVLVATLVQGAGVGLPTALLIPAFAGAMWFIGGIGHGTKNTLAIAGAPTPATRPEPELAG